MVDERLREASMDTAGNPEKVAIGHRFAELSVVSFRRPVEHEGRSIPVGTEATVVAAYADGIGYEVEVFAPFHAVVTVEADDLTE
jgi:hypothetical protein